jgi:hypothetical protein
LEQIMPWIFDLGVVVLLVCCAFNGYRHGFVKTVVRLAGSLLAILLSGALARALTGVVTTAIRDPLLDYVSGKLGDLVDVSPVVAVQGVYESLPVMVKQAFLSLTGNDLDSVWNQIGNGPLNVAAFCTDTILLPVIQSMVDSLLFIVLFFLIHLLVKRLANALGVINRIPVIGVCNELLGCVAGLLQALVYLLIFTCVLSIVIAFTSDAVPILNTNTISQTTVFRVIYEWNPFCIRG